jgi:hypothetical protein
VISLGDVAAITARCRAEFFNKMVDHSEAGSRGPRQVDPMAEDSKVKCPLCEGRGEVLRSEMVERLTNSELRKRLDARIAEILEASELAGVGPKVRNFEKEVHTWNPTLPMWQRSPKE